MRLRGFVGAIVAFAIAACGAEEQERCSGNQCINCTIDKCWISDSGTYAGCFTEPNMGKGQCCKGPTSAIEVYGCDPTGARCMTFVEDCMPYEWKYGPAPDAGAVADAQE